MVSDDRGDISFFQFCICFSDPQPSLSPLVENYNDGQTSLPAIKLLQNNFPSHVLCFDGTNKIQSYELIALIMVQYVEDSYRFTSEKLESVSCILLISVKVLEVLFQKYKSNINGKGLKIKSLSFWIQGCLPDLQTP